MESNVRRLPSKSMMALGLSPSITGDHWRRLIRSSMEGMPRPGTKRWVNIVLVIAAVLASALTLSGVSVRLLLAFLPR